MSRAAVVFKNVQFIDFHYIDLRTTLLYYFKTVR